MNSLSLDVDLDEKLDLQEVAWIASQEPIIPSVILNQSAPALALLFRKDVKYKFLCKCID